MLRPGFQERRKKYFIKKTFQTKFILKFCALVVLTALISAFVIYQFSNRSVTTVFEKSRLAIKPSTEFIMPGLILSSLVSVVLVGIATVIVVLFVSHSIAGPLYKLENSLERMAGGDLSFDIYFRRGDEAKRLAEVFNITSQSLNSIICDIRLESGLINSALKKLKALAEKSTVVQQAELREVIENLDTSYSRLNEKVNRFKLR